MDTTNEPTQRATLDGCSSRPNVPPSATPNPGAPFSVVAQAIRNGSELRTPALCAGRLSVSLLTLWRY